MKLANLFKIFPRLLNALKDEEINDKSTTDNHVKTNYWDQECLEHPTNSSCLIYCD